MYKRDLRKQGMDQYNIGGPLAAQPIQGVAPPPAAPIQKGAMEQFGDMAKQRLMTTALDKGVDKGAAMWNAATAPAAAETALTIGGAPATAAGGMAASGMGAGMATAMPYVGMGLLGAKMLGLFSQGGYVGPLSGVAYKYDGGKISASFYNKTKE